MGAAVAVINVHGPIATELGRWKDDLNRNLIKLVLADAAEFETFKNKVGDRIT